MRVFELFELRVFFFRKKMRVNICLMATYLFSPTLALSLCLWEKENAAAPLPSLLTGLVISFLLTKPLPGWSFICCLLQFILRCRNIPQPCPCRVRQAVTLSSSSLCAVALLQLSQLLLMLINLISIIDQVVWRKWEAKRLPRIRQSSRAVVAMRKVVQVLCCKGNEFPLTSCLNFSLFLPQLTQPVPGRLTLINCSLNYLLVCC